MATVNQSWFFDGRAADRAGLTATRRQLRSPDLTIAFRSPEVSFAIVPKILSVGPPVIVRALAAAFGCSISVTASARTRRSSADKPGVDVGVNWFGTGGPCSQFSLRDAIRAVAWRK